MIITNNEAALRVKCDDVLPHEIGELIQKLENELNYANKLGKGGIGLAAPQIGIAKKIAIVRLGTNSDQKFNLVNPAITEFYDPQLFRHEGCLSFPGRVEDTTRFGEIHLTNFYDKEEKFIITGLVSVVCQHEIDHLNSTLFIDHKVSSNKKQDSIKVGPNDPCFCGIKDPITGKVKKFKKCCRLK